LNIIFKASDEEQSRDLADASLYRM
jgi:hypothetical protein